MLSQLKKHDKALEHALISISLLQDEFMGLFKRNQSMGEGKKGAPQDRSAVLTIAYHNMGAEMEHLQRFEEALTVYQKALVFGQKNLNQDHPLLDTLKNVIDQVERQIQLKEQQHVINQKKKFIKQNHNKI